MAQLAVGVSFLGEYARLEKKVQKSTDKALAMFSEHTHAGLHLEKISKSKDPRVRTIRIDKFWRGIVAAPKKGERYTLLHVLPHDDAIAWAMSHSLSVNEVTGVLEISDVQALQALAEQHREPAEALLFEQVSDADLKRLGIDPLVLIAVRTVRNEAGLDELVPHVPESQADVLQSLAAGFTVEQVWADVVAPRIPDEHIDTADLDAAVERTQGRIALVDGPEELLALFAKPMAMWRVFLHPAQESVAYRPTYWGSAQVTGGPGTGKTVVALHRVTHLVRAKNLPPRSILLTTFTRGLAEALDRDLAQLLVAEQRAAVEVLNIDRWALGVVRETHGNVAFAQTRELRKRMQAAAGDSGFTSTFLLDEWREVVLATAAESEAAYLAAPRRGRGRGLTKAQKTTVWAILSRFASRLREDGLWTHHTVADEAARLVAARDHPPFRHVVVDEIQDLHPSQWRLLRAAVATGPDDLFLTGDPHQRIYGNHVSLKQVGISVAGRSTRLRINYRTSAEILRWSLGVMEDVAVADLSDGLDSLDGYRSALRGKTPTVVGAASPTAEAEDLALALEEWNTDGVDWADMAVVARTNKLVEALTGALGRHGIPTGDDGVRVATMHGMKGLEFRCVAIAAVGADRLPSPGAVTPAADDPVRHVLDVQQERCLLFVAATRARERLRVSWSGDPSPLIPPLGPHR
ncbi:UvrD-helicase domain-containing protein [Pseudonocardia alni]|uniref:UvrD-helicase domain-containing protein n=1 Tax=Pseudonocardia alni TaxID=33907 RepID=UPI00332F575D